MKHKGFVLKTSVLVIALLTSISCSDEFLDVAVQGGPTTESDPNLAEKLVTGVYNSLLQGDAFGNGDVHGFAFVSVTDIRSDDADKGSTPADQLVPVGDLDNFTIATTNRFAETLWSGYYNGIGAANQALASLANAAVPEETRNQLIGEVRFIRGYLYFNLVRLYGGVPLVLRVPETAEEANNDPAFQTRASAEAVYNAIIEDLEFAVANLKLASETGTGHATKGAAQTLLAKVHMYLNNWETVYELTEEVITSAQYTLREDYAVLFRQAGDNSDESVFEIQTGKFNNANLKVDNYTAPQGVRSGGLGGWDDLGWGFNTPSTNLINAYEPGDLRRDATIIFIDNSGTHQGTVLWDGFRVPSKDSVQNFYYNYKAYTSRLEEEFAVPQDKDRPQNIKILRYAEVLLMNAEAAVILGTGDPASRINPLRERAGLGPLGAVTLEDVWHERRVELAMEHDRFFDIVRQGRAADVMHAAGKTNFEEGTHELLPIPNSQILLSAGKLEQNPGY